MCDHYELDWYAVFFITTDLSATICMICFNFAHPGSLILEGWIFTFNRLTFFSREEFPSFKRPYDISLSQECNFIIHLRYLSH